MIIQCDHCSAKFKMDDSKLANGPVKVRCAKCKEVFVVRPEKPAEEQTAVSAPQVPLPEPDKGSVPAPESAPSGLDINVPGFSFDQDQPAEKESPPEQESPSTEQPGESNEFDWQSSSINFGASQEKEEFDLSAFESSIDSSKDSDSSHGEIPDSNDFNFDDMGSQESLPKSAEFAVPAPQDDFSLDFGEVSFGDSHSAPQESKLSPELPPQVPESFSTDDFIISSNSDSSLQHSAQSAKADGMEGVNFGDFSFGDMEPSPSPPMVKADKPDFTEAFSASSAAGFLSEEQADELPPSSLSSRKKSGSQFPLLVIIGAIALVISLAGFGVYFFSGPKAFSSVGLGFLVNWYGDKGVEEGNISLKNVSAGYTTNSSAGELFVVRGEAVNNYKKPRASIQVKVSVVGTGGAVLVSKSAYTGNSLSSEQLKTMPMAKMEEVMNNQFGDSLANLGLKPGSSIPFVIVVGSVPKDATDYTVQVSGSTVATQ